ncbi:MAG: thrombospondin type 3 repeat-containing protein, partial [Kiritimatiellae bacterium]|nr:thrombospondin type 3 repeat-containing protein [Kiritimatiellia bacterium]
FGPGPVYPPATVGPSDDPDGDGKNNLDEMISGTNPNDPLSYLRIMALSLPGQETSAVITFGNTAAGRLYNVESCTNLLAGDWVTIHTNIAGFDGTMWLADTQSPAPTRFYRIKLACP